MRIIDLCSNTVTLMTTPTMRQPVHVTQFGLTGVVNRTAALAGLAG